MTHLSIVGTESEYALHFCRSSQRFLKNTFEFFKTWPNCIGFPQQMHYTAEAAAIILLNLTGGIVKAITNN